jgi:putative heme-binding domain-containing protein
MITIRPLYVAALIFILWGLGSHPLLAAAGGAHGSPAAKQAGADSGKTLFEGNCAGCHGIDGSGAMGPSIRQAAANLGPEGITSYLKNGVMGSGMPTFGQLGDAKLALLVDYVGSLGQEGSGVTPGDPQKGKAVYNSKNCSQCHIVDGRGGDLGPDLTRIGTLRGLTALHGAVVNPGVKLPLDALLAERAQFTAYRMQRAITKDGREITGMRVNEDTFSIQLRDASGQIHSLRKFDLQTLEELPGKSMMPSYKDTLSETEISDLVGYLASLRGEQ